MPLPEFELTLGDVTLNPVPPRGAVSVEGGGRPPAERLALDGSVIVQRPPRPASRRVTITAPDTFAIRAEHADALRALHASGERFTLKLRGYELEGEFAGCLFADAPQFPRTTRPEWRGYDFILYMPQEA